MNKSLTVEYRKMQKRYKKLVLDEKKLKKDHEENIQCFLESNISDPIWQNNLEKTACYLGTASVKLKIGKMKMNQVKDMIFKSGVKK